SPRRWGQQDHAGEQEHGQLRGPQSPLSSTGRAAWRGMRRFRSWGIDSGASVSCCSDCSAPPAFRRALALQEKLVADLPPVPAYRRDLAGSQSNFGKLLSDGRKGEDALPWFDRAIALLKPLVEAEPRLAVERQYLRNAHWERAKALDRLERPANAVAD